MIALIHSSASRPFSVPTEISSAVYRWFLLIQRPEIFVTVFPYFGSGPYSSMVSR